MGSKSCRPNGETPVEIEEKTTIIRMHAYIYVYEWLTGGPFYCSKPLIKKENPYMIHMACHIKHISYTLENERKEKKERGKAKGLTGFFDPPRDRKWKTSNSVLFHSPIFFFENGVQVRSEGRLK